MKKITNLTCPVCNKGCTTKVLNPIGVFRGKYTKYCCIKCETRIKGEMKVVSGLNDQVDELISLASRLAKENIQLKIYNQVLETSLLEKKLSREQEFAKYA